MVAILSDALGVLGGPRARDGGGEGQRAEPTLPTGRAKPSHQGSHATTLNARYK